MSAIRIWLQSAWFNGSLLISSQLFNCNPCKLNKLSNDYDQVFGVFFRILCVFVNIWCFWENQNAVFIFTDQSLALKCDIFFFRNKIWHKGFWGWSILCLGTFSRKSSPRRQYASATENRLLILFICIHRTLSFVNDLPLFTDLSLLQVFMLFIWFWHHRFCSFH